jgi:hypothetical protein
MKESFTNIATVEIARLFLPLERLNSPQNLKAFIHELGWSFDGILDVDLRDLVTKTTDIRNKIMELAGHQDEEDKLTAYLELLEMVIALIKQVESDAGEIEASLSDLQVQPDVTPQELFKKTIDYLLYSYLERFHPRIFAVLHLTGIIERDEAAIRTVHWDRIPQLFTDQLGLAHEVYNWNNNDEDFQGDKVLARFEVLLRAFLIPGGIYKQSDALRDYFGRKDDGNEIRMPLFQKGVWPSGYMELCLNICPIPKKDNLQSGLALYPYFFGNLDIEKEISEYWKLNFRGSIEPAQAELCVKFTAPHNFELITGLLKDPLDSIHGVIEVSLFRAEPSGSMTYIFGSENGSHLGLNEIGFKLVALKSSEKEEFTVEFEVKDLTFVINTANGDGFILKLLSGINLKSVNDLAIGWSNLDGVYFRGSSALSVTLPSHIKLGPVVLESTTVALEINDRNLKLVLATSISAELGPVSARISRMGMSLPISFPEDAQGNLGPVNIGSLDFVPPTGAGFAINTDVISGGGILQYDEANQRYAGILALKLQKIGITAIALITTRMPDGSKGYSILINMGVTFNPAIQLFMGFTLLGVGGLIGINRTMNTQALQEGIRSKTLDSILFPDPDTIILNADKIISDLRTVFPPAEGRYVIGPMIKLAWGTPAIITADIGIFIEFPEPVRIALLGKIRARLPKPDKALIVLNIDIIGIIDLEKGELTFQGSINDSRILSFNVFGDSAFLYRWKGKPEFALSVGGFHPSFSVPEPVYIFGALRRITMNISPSSRFTITCASYQALTPNTLQFGAGAQMVAKLGRVSIEGRFSFDALIYFSPFTFEIGITGIFLVKYRGRKLSSVGIFLNLSGPRPWNARGKITVSIWIWDVEVKFNQTWGSTEAIALEPQDPLDDIKKALEQDSNWGSIVPDSLTIVEALREIKEGDGLIVHPSGNIEVRQNIVPLGLKLDKYGNAPIKDHDRFDIESIEIVSEDETDSEEITSDPVKEYFARAQIKNLSAQEKMSLPSFEKMNAGVVTKPSSALNFAGTRKQNGTEVEQDSVTNEFETILIKPDLVAEKMNDEFAKRIRCSRRFMRFAAANKAPLNNSVSQKFRNKTPGDMIFIDDEKYTVVNNQNLVVADQINGNSFSRVEADMELAQMQDSGNFRVVPVHEAIVTI